MSDQPPLDPATDAALRRLREYVAAGLALVITLGTVVMIGLAFLNIGKDLLLIVNPILGVVIGYYFNKVSTEARAENAEATAKTASVTARQATAARDQAETRTEQVRSQIQEARSTLKEVTQAAEQMLAQAPARTPGTLGVDGSPAHVEDARRALEVAVARAKRWTED